MKLTQESVEAIIGKLRAIGAEIGALRGVPVEWEESLDAATSSIQDAIEELEDVSHQLEE